MVTRAKRWWVVPAMAIGLVSFFLAAHSFSFAPNEPARPAPELNGGIAWLNAPGPIKLKDLRGKVVVLDFWTYCCINCIHTLPDLAKLEKKYEKELVVVGVHSAKFENEKRTEAIRKAVLRYQISHPVVNDAEMRIWNRFGVNSWPTLILIDPEGNQLAKVSGEGHFEVLNRAISRLIEEHEKKGTLDRKPLRLDVAREADNKNSPLYFPGKVLADAASNRLFIADSTHHRIVITDLAGNHMATVGNGEAGWVDGPFVAARFDDPQGMALDGSTLYVADRKNHVIRALDLTNQVVRTAAGTGTQSRANRTVGGPARTTALNSPWDLQLVKDTILIAMAGHHQIWSFNPKSERVEPIAGSGREDSTDGNLMSADLAQPSGLAFDGKQLYVADSESSSIRVLHLGPSAGVSTIVGPTGQGLFTFGDTDGIGQNVRLQHALGVVYHDGLLFIADTYNSKIKTVNPLTATCSTWLANGQFNEPAGLTVANGKLYVADTNAHRIQVVDLKSRAVSTLELKGVDAPRPKVAAQPNGSAR